MAEFNITRIRYKWRNAWSTTTAYKTDDIVRRNGKTFVCLQGHTAGTFATDLAANRWEVMTESVSWRNTWAASIIYEPGDIVFYAGLVYICITSHTSAVNFSTNADKWTVYLDSAEWNQDWQPSTRYGVNDIVKYNGIVYKCVNEHTSSTTFNGLEVGNNDGEDDSTLETWQVLHEGIEYRGDWDNAVRYRVNDLVKFGGSIWRCTQGHQSLDDSSFNFDREKFVIELPGEQFRGAWNAATAYGTGDVVTYGGYLYVCTRSDINDVPSTTTQAWSILSKNYDYKGAWDVEVDYKPGDIVLRGGRLYIANQDNPGQTLQDSEIIVTVGPPASGDLGNKYYFDGVYLDTPIFEVGTTYTFVQNDATNVYFPNATGGTLNTHPLLFSIEPEVIAHPAFSYYLDGVVYKLDGEIVTQQEYFSGFAEADSRTVSITITALTPSTIYYWCWNHRGMGTYFTVTSSNLGADPSNAASWTTFVPGEKWRGGWVAQTEYVVGDIVAYENYNYVCIQTHIANSSQNFPGNGSGYNTWQVYLQGEPDNVLTVKGDLLAYGVQRDGSSVGAIAIPIANDTRKLLTIEQDSTFGYQEHGAVTNLIYVGPTGVDADGYGLTQGHPFRTINYAADYAETNLTGETKIFVRTGKYYEILPIVVPAETCIQGEEVRSVTVEAAPAGHTQSLTATYMLSALARLDDILGDILANVEITKSTGNTLTQLTNVGEADPTTITSVTALIADIVKVINFYINSTGPNATITGTNTPLTGAGFLNAAAILEANKEFIAQEIVSYVDVAFPAVTFTADYLKRDIRRFINAFKYDLIYIGNYKTVRAAKFYKNTVTGCSGEDMFYVRDATGIRNMTLQGLLGSLNPPQTFELYQRPTGGAYVSLDPGWGPNDENVWITSRSCYVQNCTTFGFGAVGQKIDGALHNGGNKSIVSNDFTQVISDGIGAWVTNGGRAELVSVFTYYSQIGYFAEDGGTIRATNGNCSYGNYGALAQGNDPTEVPTYGFVNNRTNEAIVGQVFAGDFDNKVYLLEYDHCGEQYTTTTYNFVGAGTGLSVVQEDYRDNAISNVFLLDSAPGEDDAGGGGWTTFGNNAQNGNLTTITLASNDNHTEAQVLGLRLIITSGDGTGQYGYIGSFNPSTKIATIYKESTGAAGWDHIVPGTPLVNPLGTNTTYRCEPRPIFSAPPYSAGSTSMISAISAANVVYGEVTKTFSGISGSAGTGTTIDIPPATATFNITKAGRKYTVAIASAGAGYELGQEVTILGSNLGGNNGDNDITITVTGVSDDSTNAITSIEYIGAGTSGNFVITPASGSTGYYSSNGADWSSITFPSTGNWKALAAGYCNGASASNQFRFVAARFNSDAACYSLDGQTWSTTTMPGSRDWNSIVWGRYNNLASGIFVAIAGNLNSGAWSYDGVTWNATTLPDQSDSTVSEWVDIAAGKNKFVAIANSGNAVAVGTFSAATNTMTWQAVVIDVGDSSQLKDWTSIAYGNNRFVIVSSTGDVAYSFDGLEWYFTSQGMPSSDGSTEMYWRKIRYGQGVFFAVCDTGSRFMGASATTGPTTYAATSEDGIVWTDRTLANSQNWVGIAFGNPDLTLQDSTYPNSKGMWIAVTSDSTNVVNQIFTGCRAKGRPKIETGIITQMRLWDPGSGYDSPPTLTMVDPSNSAEVYVRNRLADGVLSQPSFISRGDGYKTVSTSCTITGDGFADIIPISRYVTVEGMDFIPGPGAQFRFGGATNFYNVVLVLSESTNSLGKYTAEFQISPPLTTSNDLGHGVQVEIRQRYSQCRITGHDFLDVGTGNFAETNYPELYSTGLYTASPENEIYEGLGGRVFYTSTDQSGNFRTGELFAVEQATGVVTISADFFTLEGLTELALGGVRLGGSGTVIREFSTDPLFLADSNNVVPTQRAIVSYLQNRLSVGGSDLSVPDFIAGIVRVGPTSINTTTGDAIKLPVVMNFIAAPRGQILATAMFYRSFYTE